MTTCVNHFGPFLLTNLLMDALRKTPASRVIIASCRDYEKGQWPASHPMFSAQTFDASAAVSTSKLMNVLFTQELQRRLTEAEADVTADCVIVDADANKSAQSILAVAASQQFVGAGGRLFIHTSLVSKVAKNVTTERAKQLWALSETATLSDFALPHKSQWSARAFEPARDARFSAVRRQSVAARRASTAQVPSQPEPVAETHEEAQTAARDAAQEAMKSAMLADRRASQTIELRVGVENTALMAENISKDAFSAARTASST
eukprot:TRINITY_DN6681_c0_g1_i1.p1 TRINITY_DN6681_c0_g1~~TRINITY_DN6681_c0_g1_i1.p1  ORF type:complete len:263 (+),score=52.68 TRINITY_DN6681_c0_g1_i1:450-1238(+)